MVGYSVLGQVNSNGFDLGHASLYQQGHFVVLGNLSGDCSRAYSGNDAGKTISHSWLSGDVSYIAATH